MKFERRCFVYNSHFSDHLSSILNMFPACANLIFIKNYYKRDFELNFVGDFQLAMLVQSFNFSTREDEKYRRRKISFNFLCPSVSVSVLRCGKGILLLSFVNV